MSGPEVDARLDELAAWIARAGTAAGLTNYATAADVRDRGIAPAGMIASRIGESGARIAEIGAGSGALGLAVAVLLTSASVVLVDSAAKSVAFIEMTARRLAIANAVAIRSRLPVENVADIGGPFDWVIVRAFAPGDIAVPVAAGLCTAGGSVLWLHADGDPAATRNHGRAKPVSVGDSGVPGLRITEFLVLAGLLSA